MSYRAPLNDILSALRTAGGLSDLIAKDILGDLDEETLQAIVEEAGKFAAEELAPLSEKGDRDGSQLVEGAVVTPEGWKTAYDRFCEAGWTALTGPEEFGGQHLPCIVSTAVSEIWNSANLSFGLCPLLTQGAVDALNLYCDEETKQHYLPRLVSGEWTGTMNLTEPQAGSDLAALAARAEPQTDGSYRIFGTKIFISYGEHDLTDNIVHTVLARLPDAPAGTRGISFFLVPKYLVNADGSLGERNDVKCVGLEHKLGIHASPTCVMAYGEDGGATGYLIGEPNRGLQVMFVLMNAARLGVGVQGVAVAERATQRAIAYAQERKQGAAVTAPGAGSVAIIQHADVRRTLLTMRALTQASRCICMATARNIDEQQRSNDETQRTAAGHRAALLTPIAKAFSTDMACEVASLGIQVHGGMGFIEETGAAQHFRDARILPIYEGTNGIQAIDLVGRKLTLEGGDVVRAYMAELDETAAAVSASNVLEFGQMGARLADANAALAQATDWLIETLSSNPEAALTGATPYLRLFGLTAGGAYLAREALAANRGETDGSQQVARARFFAENLVVTVPGLAQSVVGGADAVLGVPPETLAG